MTQPSPTRSPLNIVIACGGTGGHLFPGIAVARNLKSAATALRSSFPRKSGRPGQQKLRRS
ncbi:MAG: glycosyltransferase [Akkermansia sp.]